ncbi:PWWP domain-containing protein 2A [Salmo trutta]|uniref:PWWP domain containing 2A n=1 Tax=Salmo trutta TaxID=8032 RepID=A0A674CGD9_SALTR|nr:PWWP domain-containing protein 2A-like [Salmo trutta]XP_029555484.1 PWWP domain-containing protein 2A-like [Salmo trutta]
MAAVAAEPGAAAASTTTAGNSGDFEPEPVPEAKIDFDATQEYAPAMDHVHQLKDGDAVQECNQVQMELVNRPDLEAAGKALAASAEDEQIEAGCLGVGVEKTENHALEGFGSKYTMSRAERLKQFFSPNVEPANEVSKHEPYACHQNSSISDSQPSVVFLHSFPAQPVATEAGLSLAEPAEPIIDYDKNPELTKPTNIECDYRALIKPSHEAELDPEPTDEFPSVSEYKNDDSSEAASLERPQSIDHVDFLPIQERETVLGTPMEAGYMCDFSSITTQNIPRPVVPVMPVDQVPSSAELGDSCSPQRFETNCSERDPVSKPSPHVSGAETEEVQTDSVHNLIPGSEVLVSLDHIIDDALVVSFQLGKKIFSGVLMDLSKRFGPYGIPITLFPEREYKDKPESMQLKTEHLQPETENVEKPVQENPDGQVVIVPEPNPDPQPKPNPWTSKPPPLFQEGAPYPPPLFIRDTYNQSLPQPPPRKIRRPKRRLYREEPTSIMNAIKLRPRQVLCDKCKGAVTTVDKREPRRGPVSDSRSEDAKRRRNDSTAAAVSKRLRNDPRSEEKSRAAEVAKRQVSSSSSSLGQVKGGAGGNRVLRATSTTTSSPVNSGSRVQLNAKKVLQSKNVDHSKAREVLKLAKVQKRQRETTVVTDSSGNAKTMTRAAALQEAHAHQKVHFTRRLQQISGVGPSNATPLPPRMRIKPQRYRNEESHSSTCKLPCLEKVPGSGCLSPPKPDAPCCTATRSSSSSCSTGQAAAAESQGPDNGPEPEVCPQTQPQVEPPTATEHGDPKVEPVEQGGQEERRETCGSKAGNLVVFMNLNPGQPDSSNTSMCSVDSADDLKSSDSECSSTESFNFPPPGRPSPAVPGTSSAVADPSPAPTEEKKPCKSQKVFSKNVSKCVSLEGRTICVGDIVWAKIYGFPWWPARVLGIQISRKDNGLLVRQEARVAWFGSPTTSFLALAQVAPFLESFQSRFDKKRKGLYRKAITEAAKAAKQLTPEVRALLTQFET